LIGLWGVYALKADLRRIDNKRITIDNSGNTGEVSGLRRHTFKHHCCEYRDTHSHC
jgi:hypothetical protein